MRPKVRRKRLQFQLAFMTLAGLLVLAAAMLRRTADRWPELKERWALRAAGIEASPELMPFLDGSLEGSGGDWRSQSDELRRRFPFIRAVTAKPSWFRRALVLKVTAFKSVGKVKNSGTKRSFLSEEGVVFEAPAGLYPEELPLLDLRGAQEGEWKELSRYLVAVGGTGLFPSPLIAVRYVSGADGWTAVLEDGTEVLWGSLRWTEEKLVRLKAALEDVRARPDPGMEPGAALTADLRYFEDGRILLRARSRR